MSGWMKKDGVLSSFHFNVFSDSLQIRSPYAPPLKPLIFQRFFKFLKWLDLVGSGYKRLKKSSDGIYPLK